MPLVVNVVTPPPVEPVSLAEAKVHLRLDPDSAHPEDSLIASLVTASRRLCETRAGVVFVNTVFDQVDDAFPFTGGFHNRQVRAFYGQFASGQGCVYPGVLALNAGILTLPRAPLVSVQSVTYVDVLGQTQVWDPAKYTVEAGAPGRMSPRFGEMWPVTLPQIGAVVVRFTAGYGPDATTVPENVKAAIKLVLGHLYGNRELVSQDGAYAVMPPSLAVDGLLGIESNTGGYS